MKLKLIFLLVMVAILTPNTSSFSQGSTLIGYLDAVKYEKGFFFANGWAADKEEGASVIKVEVYIDKKLVGKATLGLNRPDVPVVMKNPAWGKSGWRFVSKISLKKGIHEAYAMAYDKKNASRKLINEKIFKVE
jgi:hypothetical protein